MNHPCLGTIALVDGQAGSEAGAQPPCGRPRWRDSEPYKPVIACASTEKQMLVHMEFPSVGTVSHYAAEMLPGCIQSVTETLERLHKQANPSSKVMANIEHLQHLLRDLKLHRKLLQMFKDHETAK